MATSVMARHGFLLTVLTISVSSTALGVTLQDPTRPPHELDEGVTSSISYPQVKGLQSVIISPGHCAAIIDGRTVLLGAMHGGDKLVEISERGVVMQGDRGRRMLAMFPGVEMKIIETAASRQEIKCQYKQSLQASKPVKKAASKEKK